MFLQSKPTNHEKFEGGIRSIRNRSTRYEDLGYIGAGGNGVVCLARDLTTNEPVAVKKMEYDSSGDARKRLAERDFMAQFEYNNYIVEYREAFLVERFADPDPSDPKERMKTWKNKAFRRNGLFKWKTYMSSGASPYQKPLSVELWLVQEFCELGDMFHIVQTLAKEGNGPGLDFGLLRHVLANLVAGLQAIHGHGIVHRDIKSLNVLVTRAGRVKICDFGRSENQDLEKDHLVDAITYLWMAPEMWVEGGGVYYGTEVDIWSLGITLLELRNGTPPFYNLTSLLARSNISNLPDLSLEQQREQLCLPPPPEKLVAQSKGKSNNYRNYFKSKYELEMEPDSDSDASEERPPDIQNIEEDTDLKDSFKVDSLAFLADSNVRRSFDEFPFDDELEPEQESEETKLNSSIGNISITQSQKYRTTKSNFIEVDIDSDLERSFDPEASIQIDESSVSRAPDSRSIQKSRTVVSQVSRRTSVSLDSQDSFVNTTDPAWRKKQKTLSKNNRMPTRFRAQTLLRYGKRRLRFNTGRRTKQSDSTMDFDVSSLFEDVDADGEGDDESISAAWGLRPKPKKKQTGHKGLRTSAKKTLGSLQRHSRKVKSKTGKRRPFASPRASKLTSEWFSSVKEDIPVLAPLSLRKSKKGKTKHKTLRVVGIDELEEVSDSDMDQSLNRVSKELREGMPHFPEPEPVENQPTAKQAWTAEMNRSRKLMKLKRSESFTTLSKYSDEVQFYEFVAWCLTTVQKKRPTIEQLARHPFIREELRSLEKSEKTECGIRQHSDFLLRADAFGVGKLKDDILNVDDEEESDDDMHLTKDELEHESKLSHVQKNQQDGRICTCSTSQRYIRENLCNVLAPQMKSRIPQQYREDLRYLYENDDPSLSQ